MSQLLQRSLIRRAIQLTRPALTRSAVTHSTHFHSFTNLTTSSVFHPCMKLSASTSRPFSTGPSNPHTTPCELHLPPVTHQHPAEVLTTFELEHPGTLLFAASKYYHELHSELIENQEQAQLTHEETLSTETGLRLEKTKRRTELVEKKLEDIREEYGRWKQIRNELQGRLATHEKYTDLLKQLLAINKDRKIRLGIETTADLLKALGANYDITKTKIPTIHIAGSNGKGSVATKIAKALELHGLNVGLYTSPHISSYRERLQVNQDIITEQEMVELLPHILDVTRQTNIPATFFEIGTALAFGFFIQRKVDVAVIEVGLGGRLDSTNVITPELSVITSISLEHTAWLGDTIQKITREKAGIIKPNIPVLIGPAVDAHVVREVLREKKGGELAQCTKHFDDYDQENSETARQAMQILSKRPAIHALLSKTASRSLNQSLVEHAMHTRPPCRFQRVRYVQPGPGQYVDEAHEVDHHRKHSISHTSSSGLEFVLDVCHNPAAFARLFQKLEHTYQHRSNFITTVNGEPKLNVHAIVGFSSDKDFTSCMELLMSRCKAVYVVQADSPRAATVKEVLDKVAEQGLRAKYPSCQVQSISPSPWVTVKHQIEAFQPSESDAPASDHSSRSAVESPPVILCCGTFFILSDVRLALSLPHPVDDLHLNEQSMTKND